MVNASENVTFEFENTKSTVEKMQRDLIIVGKEMVGACCYYDDANRKDLSALFEFPSCFRAPPIWGNALPNHP